MMLLYSNTEVWSFDEDGNSLISSNKIILLNQSALYIYKIIDGNNGVSFDMLVSTFMQQLEDVTVSLTAIVSDILSFLNVLVKENAIRFVET